MTEAHLPEVMRIERAVFLCLAGRRRRFRSDLRNPAALYLVLELDGKIVAYAGMWLVVDEAHITNVAVLPEYRGRDFAKRLIHRLLSNRPRAGLRPKATLEVRVSKHARAAPLREVRLPSRRHTRPSITTVWRTR
jgi:ribosomal-protein-alanine N-acetyltransferase